jgi:hypothetical protein
MLAGIENPDLPDAVSATDTTNDALGTIAPPPSNRAPSTSHAEFPMPPDVPDDTDFWNWLRGADPSDWHGNPGGESTLDPFNNDSGAWSL